MMDLALFSPAFQGHENLSCMKGNNGSEGWKQVQVEYD
jgi:hypothetical protein